MPVLQLSFEMTGSTSSINDTQRSDLKQKLALFLGAPTTAVSLTFQDVAASDSASDEGSAQGDTGLSRRMAAANEPVLSVQSTVKSVARSQPSSARACSITLAMTERESSSDESVLAMPRMWTFEQCF